MTRPARKRPTVVLGLWEPIDPGAIPMLCARVRSLLEESRADLLTCDVEALCNPDVVTIDVLARLQLTARQLGRSIQLRHARSELVELLTLAGLQEILPLVSDGS